MKSEKIFHDISIMLNVFWGVLLLPYAFFSLLSLMATDGFMNPHTPEYEIFVYAIICVIISVNIFIIAGIILSIYYRKHRKIYKSIFVQLFPIVVFMLGVVLSNISEYFRL